LRQTAFLTQSPPWKYCGWLIHYVQGLHAREFPQLGDRWGYFIRTLAAGRLLDEPIPQATFAPDRSVLRKLESWIAIVEESGQGGWNAYSLFVAWLAWALDVGPEPRGMDDKLSERLYRAVNLELWMQHPGDYLGDAACERFGGGPFAFFPTPHELCEAMVRMTMGNLTLPDGRDPRIASVMEPACGSGRLLLHASNYSLNLRGIDKDPLMVTLCKINMALYAPWGVHGLPWSGIRGEVVKVGDSLALDTR